MSYDETDQGSGSSKSGPEAMDAGVGFAEGKTIAFRRCAELYIRSRPLTRGEIGREARIYCWSERWLGQS